MNYDQSILLNISVSGSHSDSLPSLVSTAAFLLSYPGQLRYLSVVSKAFIGVILLLRAWIVQSMLTMQFGRTCRQGMDALSTVCEKDSTPAKELVLVNFDALSSVSKKYLFAGKIDGAGKC